MDDVAVLHLRAVYLIGDGVPRDHRKTVSVLTVAMLQLFTRNPMSQLTLSSCGSKASPQGNRISLCGCLIRSTSQAAPPPVQHVNGTQRDMINHLYATVTSHSAARW